MSSRNFSGQQQESQQATRKPVSVGTEQAENPPSTRIRALHVLILGGLGALGPLANDTYIPALPALSHDLAASASQTQMTLSAFILGLALGQVIAGPISDARGRRWPLLIGVAAFALASLLCMIAPSIYLLVALRFVQGVAGAGGTAIALAIVSDLYVDIARARFFSLLMQMNGLAPMVAPIIGGQLLRFTSWHGVFFVMALGGAIMFLTTMFGLGETLPMSRRQRGGVSATVSAFCELLMDRRFVGYALSCGFAFTACIIFISVSPFILQGVYGISPQMLGMLFGVDALGIVLVAQLNGRLVGRVSSQKLLIWGYAAMALGGMSLLVVVLIGMGLLAMVPSFFILTSSLGLIMPNATTLALADTRAAGSASALLGVLQFAIGAVVAPLVGLGGTTSALPMAVVIAGFGIATLVTFIVLCRPARPARA